MTKKITSPIILIFTLIFTFGNIAFADDIDPTSTLPKSYISDTIQDQIASHCKSPKTYCTSSFLTNVYSKHNYKLIWSKNGILSKKGRDAFRILQHSYEDGLDPNNYNIKEITSILADIKQLPSSNQKSNDQNNSDIKASDNIKKLSTLDVLLTDALLRYIDNVHNGIIDTKKIFPHWSAKKALVNPEQVLKNMINSNANNVINNIKPKYIGYTDLKRKLAEYRKILANNPWNKVSGSNLTIGDSGSKVKKLQHRLMISGELGNIKKFGKFDESTESAVTLFQENMGLLDNGIADSDTIEAMNVPVETRIQQIELNMDIMRSFPDSLGSEYILINIPGYSLNLLKNNNNILNMDVAVGSSKHQSCILNSKTTYLVANPAWHVPRGIAESEVFPLLQQGTGTTYLRSHNIQTFKIIGNKTILINPDKVNWSEMSVQDFKNYRFTQKPGNDNLLGKVKFIFRNQCEIYLHDSIESDVFDASERDLSHGCIRMGEPMKLTSYVLTNEGFSSEQIHNLFKDKIDQSVTFKHPLNIYIVYLTSLVNQYDFVQFRDDIYNLLNPYLDSFPVAQPKHLDDVESSTNN